MDVQTLIQGGAVGLALALILVLYFVLKMLFKIITNHLDHQSKTMKGLEKAIRELITYLRQNNKKHGS
jgi:uncharacterized protein YoxC